MIIGVSGKLQSGKDTIGKIIQRLAYCNHVGQDLVYEDRFPLPYIPNQFQIKKFAGKLKQIVSLLTGYTAEELEKEEIKNTQLGEEWWYIQSKAYARTFAIEAWNGKLPDNNYNLIKPTIRLILQRLGTEALREIIHPNVHINALFVDYKPTCAQCIRQTLQDPGNGCTNENDCDCIPNWAITDVRFPNECEAIKNKGGILIRNERYMLTKIDQHPSEIALDNYDKFDYIIQNAGTIQDLVIKVKEILINEKIIK